MAIGLPTQIDFKAYRLIYQFFLQLSVIILQGGKEYVLFGLTSEAVLFPLTLSLYNTPWILNTMWRDAC